MNVRRTPLYEAEPDKPKVQISPSMNSPSIDLSSYMTQTSEPGSPGEKKCFTSNNISDLDTYKSKPSPGIRQYNAIRASLEPNTVLLL